MCSQCCWISEHEFHNVRAERHPVLIYGDKPVVLGSIGLPSRLVDCVRGLLKLFTYSFPEITLFSNLARASDSPPTKYELPMVLSSIETRSIVYGVSITSF